MEKRKMNKKVRLCLVKNFENGNYLYKIEGALFIVSILNSSKAFGYHLKKQATISISLVANLRKRFFF